MTDNDNQGIKLKRREFLSFAWVLSSAALALQAAAAMLQFFKPRTRSGAYGGTVIAGQAAEFEPGTVSHIQEGRFYISSLEDGGLMALWHQCPHLGCTVPWRESEDRFHCPCHSSIFSTRGEVLSGPSPRPLDIFLIEIVEGEVWVDTSQAVTRKEHLSSHVTYP